MKRRILCLLLALVMAVGAMPTGVGAINTEDSSPATYETDETGTFWWHISEDDVWEEHLHPKAAKPYTGTYFSFNLYWKQNVKVSRLRLYVVWPNGETCTYDTDDEDEYFDAKYPYYSFFPWFEYAGKLSYYWQVTYQDGTTQTLKKTTVTVDKGRGYLDSEFEGGSDDAHLSDDKGDSVHFGYSEKKRSGYLWAGVEVGDGAIRYQSNNKNIKIDKKGKVTIPGKYIGAATITITLTETVNYKKNTEKLYIFAHPKKAAIKKVTSPKKSQLKVTWGKVPSCDGYYVWYAVKGSKKWKRVTVNKKATSAVVKGLKSRKYYKIYVSSYKKYGKIHYWSSSKTKTIKVK